MGFEHPPYLQPAIRDFGPGIGIENIFDKTDDRPWNNNFSTLNPGRSVYVSLSVRFKK